MFLETLSSPRRSEIHSFVRFVRRPLSGRGGETGGKDTDGESKRVHLSKAVLGYENSWKTIRNRGSVSLEHNLDDEHFDVKPSRFEHVKTCVCDTLCETLT